ncbi:MAG: hypothetical protein QN188_04270 [Armatimonadota bacterium]|nr:hypothetical protein [Armatimonadota bacterium]MDR7430345.1 hypothetical protein [Armatimonadota bacterium]MDR7432935.1 hypothetical protein [Armatimonadota bacterium]MDR7445915.1 hypothetical protein [Armatimonadota bacterium]MDR7513900.1 hypothetical protein [Armatimonadota bacterium]
MTARERAEGQGGRGPTGRVAVLLACATALLTTASAAASPVEGVVVHGETGRPVAGVEVRVVGMEPGKPPVEVVSRTDRGGRFQARLQPVRRTYVVQATFDGVTYTSGPYPASGALSAVTLRVFDATREPPALRISRRALLLDREGPWFVLREVTVVHNPSLRTYVGAASSAGTWRVPLLRGAQDVRVVRGMVPAGVDPDGALVDTLPVQPGERAAVVMYRVRARGPSLLELPTGLATESLDVFVAEPLRVGSEVLRLREVRQVEGMRVAWLQARGLPPDAVVPLRVEGVPEEPRGASLLLAALLAVGSATFVAWPWLARRG